MRDELLKETLFFTIGQARIILELDRRYTERPHSSLDHATRRRSPPNSKAPTRDNTGLSLVARWIKAEGHGNPRTSDMVAACERKVARLRETLNEGTGKADAIQVLRNLVGGVTSTLAPTAPEASKGRASTARLSKFAK